MRLAFLALLSFSSSAQITPANVSQLKVAWTYDTRESVEYFRRDPRFEATPVYAAGILYISTPGGFVAALEAETGREIWKTDLHVSRDRNYSDFANRGVTLGGDTIFVGTADARLIAIDRANGKLRPGFGTEGTVDLTQGLRRKPQYSGEYGVSSPPAFFRDVIIVGSFVADNSRAKMSSGEVRAFDAKTGALRWTFHPLPEDSPAGAANTWSRIVVDEANGLVFLPTGSASPDYYGGLRPGDNRDANSIVVLKSRHRRSACGLPNRSSRPLGLRRRFAAAAVSRKERSGGRGRIENGSPVPVRSPDGKAAVPDRGAPRSGERRARRRRIAHAAVPYFASAAGAASDH